MTSSSGSGDSPARRSPAGAGSPSLHAELVQLVGAFAERLRWEQRRGVEWVAAAPCPRISNSAAPDVSAPGDGVGVAQPSFLEQDDANDVAPVGAVDPATALQRVRAELGACDRCRLAEGRRQLVFGDGAPAADVMFIGEAPGREEDEAGHVFVGAAGQLLTRMIKAMGLERDEVYIGNIIKCRPPRNRDPQPDEVAACEPFLLQQIEAIAPRIILALGNFAAKTLLRTDTGITRLRGQWHTYHGIPLMPTFHPAYLLRNPAGKRAAWSDLQAVMTEMDRLGLRRRQSQT